MFTHIYFRVLFCVCVLVFELEGFKGVLDWRSGPRTRRRRQSKFRFISLLPSPRESMDSRYGGGSAYQTGYHDPLQDLLYEDDNSEYYADHTSLLRPAGGAPLHAPIVDAPAYNRPLQASLSNSRPFVELFRPGGFISLKDGADPKPQNPMLPTICFLNPNDPSCQPSNLPAPLNSLSWASKIKDSRVELPARTIGNPQKRLYLLGFGFPNYMYKACVTPSSQQGRCRFLQYCPLPEIISSWESFVSHACAIGNEFVGVCCRSVDSLPSMFLTTIRPPIALTPLPAPTKPPLPVTVKPPIVTFPPITKPSVDLTRNCGLRQNTQERIVGGQVSVKDDWPWMAALLRNQDDQYCGATLISDRHILTASHCVDGFKPDNITVRLGDYDFTKVEPGEKDFAVERIIMHENYDRKTYKNDIAVLKLKKAVSYSRSIYPICLPPEKLNLAGKSCFVAGWGTLAYNGIPSDILMQVALPVWGDDECKKSYSQPINPDLQICVGVKVGQHDSCQGDSGGPFMCLLDDGKWTTVGVVSWGYRCAIPGKPGVYTRISAYIPWIKNAFSSY